MDALDEMRLVPLTFAQPKSTRLYIFRQGFSRGPTDEDKCLSAPTQNFDANSMRIPRSKYPQIESTKLSTYTVCDVKCKG